MSARLFWLLLLVLLAGGAITWNAIFDAYVDAGANEYVERQARHVAGRGAAADMDSVMDAAISAGVRAASLYSSPWLVAAGAAVLHRVRRARRRRPARTAPPA